MPSDDRARELANEVVDKLKQGQNELVARDIIMQFMKVYGEECAEAMKEACVEQANNKQKDVHTWADDVEEASYAVCRAVKDIELDDVIKHDEIMKEVHDE